LRFAAPLHLANADTNEPVFVPNRSVLSNNSPTYFTIRAMAPSTPTASSLPQSPADATNFLAMLSNQELNFVPDTHGAVGTNVVMGIFNNGVTFHTRSGAVIRTNTLRDFWTSTNIAPYQRVFDPRVVYDPYYHRWIAVAATDNDSTNSTILIGVSLTSNPTNAWNMRQIKADTNNLRWADYPTIGFNKDWIVVQANMIYVSPNALPLHSHIYVFNKTNLYTGGGFFTHHFCPDQCRNRWQRGADHHLRHESLRHVFAPERKQQYECSRVPQAFQHYWLARGGGAELSNESRIYSSY
jgi:hypothetical protein